MGRSPCCEKMGLKKGPWTPEEDHILINFIRLHGHPNWRALPKQAGLLRCGKSCRLRWTNYLRPDIKRGNFTPEEEETIIKLHQQLGNRWSTIAAKLPGRTDNEIKNVWHTHLKKRLPQTSTSTSTSTNEQTKKRTRKPKSAKKSDAPTVPKIEHAMNCMQQSSDDDNNTSQPASPQPCTSSSEISSGSENNNVSMENVVDGGEDYFGDLIQMDNDFWMDLLPCIQDTAISTPGPNYSSDLLMIQPQGFLEMSSEADHETDMDLYWFHLLVKSNELTELSQVL